MIKPGDIVRFKLASCPWMDVLWTVKEQDLFMIAGLSYRMGMATCKEPLQAQ